LFCFDRRSADFLQHNSFLGRVTHALPGALLYKLFMLNDGFLPRIWTLAFETASLGFDPKSSLASHPLHQLACHVISFTSIANSSLETIQNLSAVCIIYKGPPPLSWHLPLKRKRVKKRDREGEKKEKALVYPDTPH
jgi:hypothetical protein